MLSLCGFEAAIVCDDKELDTYGPTTNQRTASGWIATEVGKPFSIRVRQVAEGHHPQFQQNIYIDGKQTENWLGRDPDSCTLAGMYPTATTFEPYLFSALQTTDSLAAATSDKQDEDMGSIKIVIRRRIAKTSTSASTRTYAPPTAAPVHERNKKRILGGQSVSTGPTKTVRPLVSVQAEPYDPMDPDPYVTFAFRYRSRDYLLAEDIIPHLPRPAEKSADDATLTPDEPGEEPEVKPAKRRIDLETLEEKRKRIRLLKDQLRNIEAEVAEDLELPPPDVKREPFPFAVGVVVDLTGPETGDRKRRKVKQEPEIVVGASAGSTIDLTDD